MIELEGIKLTYEMIELIKDWQADILQYDLKCIDNAISFIAREGNGSSPDEAQKCLTLISSLCALKEEIKTFKIKTT